MGRFLNARWALAADLLARHGHAIELKADGLPRIARPLYRCKQGKAPRKQEKMVLRPPGGEW